MLPNAGASTQLVFGTFLSRKKYETRQSHKRKHLLPEKDPIKDANKHS
jgi:hypothetical protein